MPRRSVPKYSLHKGTGQARVRIDGQDIYLGVFGSADSHQRYAEAISKWQRELGKPVQDITIGTLTKLYMERCKSYYRKGGVITSEVNAVRIVLRHLNRKFRSLPAAEFDALKLKVIRESMIEAGYVRTSINQHTSRLRTMFKWAAGEKLVSQSTWLELTTVEGLKEGRSRAVEASPVGTVPDAFVDAVKPFVTTIVWQMIQVQRLTGMRPGEVIKMRGVDLITTGAVWEYRPGDHKTKHHGKSRTVLIGKSAQQILKPLPKTDLQAILFNPMAGRAEFVSKNYRKGAATKIRNARKGYSVTGYSSSIKRACVKAGVPPWTPNQLRHNFATLARREGGIEGSRVLLGHSSAVTTEIYAERDLEAARAIAAKIG